MSGITGGVKGGDVTMKVSLGIEKRMIDSFTIGAGTTDGGVWRTDRIES